MSLAVTFENPLTWLGQQFELSRGGEASNVRPMEGLRGFAVFLVFLVHYVTQVDPWIEEQAIVRPLARALHTIGNTGVDLFFVLSGYLIYGSLVSRAQKFGRFMARRLERIYPAFIAVFVVYVVLSLTFPAESKLPHKPFDAILYLGGNFLLLPGLFPIEPLITVAWSLSYEMFFYLVIPLLISVLALRARASFWRILLFSAMAVVWIAYCAVSGRGHIRLVMFVSGILLYETIRNGRVSAPTSAVALGALVFGLLSTLIPLGGSQGGALKTSILFVAFFALCFAVFVNSTTWLARGFSWTPVRWLGNMSYSYYLLHGLTLKAAFLALGILVPISRHGSYLFWVLLPPMFALTLGASALLFIAIERPFSLAPARSQGRLPRSNDGSANRVGLPTKGDS